MSRAVGPARHLVGSDEHEQRGGIHESADQPHAGRPVHVAGRAVPRKEILARVWTENLGGSGRTLDMHISTLRRKLGDDPNQPTMITTVRSVGFRFERGG